MYDFGKNDFDSETPAVLWTAAILPSVVTTTSTPPEIARSDVKSIRLRAGSTIAQEGPELLIRVGKSTFRVHVLGEGIASGMCVVLPMDILFDRRVTAALRLWLALNRRKVPANPARLTKYQRTRYVLALRAMDARLVNVSYRDIATGLFGPKRIPGRAWKTHDVRGRTIRLCKLARTMMRGGYRQLLVYPYRKRF